LIPVVISQQKLFSNIFTVTWYTTMCQRRSCWWWCNATQRQFSSWRLSTPGTIRHKQVFQENTYIYPVLL